MKKTGKSTLIKRLMGDDLLDDTYKRTKEIQQSTKRWFSNGKFYECTFIDTPGLTNNIRQKLSLIDEINLIMFVFKYGQSNDEAVAAFSNLFEDTRDLSVSIITFCDTLTDSDYDDITRKFRSDPCTKQFSGRRVFPIGFPNADHIEESKRFIEKNISKLHQLIEMPSGCTPVIDVRDYTLCSIM